LVLNIKTKQNLLAFPVYDSKKSSTYTKNGKSASVTSAKRDYLEYAFGLDKLLFGKGFLSTDTLK